MVGVPRSKGCANCRRRKVACDQEKPQCRVCVKRGVQCEGYARYPVVLQWTKDGLKKRERFEEIAPSQPPSSRKSTSSTASTPSSTSLTVSPRETLDIFHGNSPQSDDDFNVVLPRQVSPDLTILELMLVRCLESYLPDGVPAIADVKANWMWRISEMPARGTVLGCSFAALTFARLGAVRNDQDLVIQGRKQYGLALTHLQTALYDPELVFQDRTLAAMRTLSIYELLSPTFAPMPPGKTHEDGMMQWCCAAGPKAIKTDFALEVFQDVRWSIMIHSIDRSKSSILGTKDWLTVPWLNGSKDSLQRLYDYGFAIGNLLEKVNKCDVVNDSYDATALASKCLDIAEQLENWYTDTWGTFDEQTVLLMGGLFEASNIVYYWWFKLTLNEALITLHPPSGIVDDVDSPTSAQELANTALQQNNVKLASDIVFATPFFSAEDTGWLGPQRILFPLKKAMVELGKARSPVFAKAQAVLTQMVQKMRAC